MRLPVPRVWGPPRDRNAAIGVVRRALELGVRVIDTAWYYGPEVAHRILAEALSPYHDDLVLVTKLGGARRDDGTWYADLPASGLRRGCEDDLRLLGIDEVPVTHLRWDDEAGVPFEDALETMLALQKEGKIRHLGLSNVSLGQLELAMTQAEIVTVSNAHSVTDRSDDAVGDRCTAHAIPYLPYFPLAIGKVKDHSALLQAAEKLGATPAQVALAWLLSGSRVMLPIPGTRSLQHLEDNPSILAESDAGDPRQRILEVEPAPVMEKDVVDLPQVAAAFGDLADLKTPFTHGHSKGVARLAKAAAEALGLDTRAVKRLIFAGELDGRPDEEGIVYVDEASVDAHRRGNESNNLSNEPRRTGPDEAGPAEGWQRSDLHDTDVGGPTRTSPDPDSRS